MQAAAIRQKINTPLNILMNANTPLLNRSKRAKIGHGVMLMKLIYN